MSARVVGSDPIRRVRQQLGRCGLGRVRRGVGVATDGPRVPARSRRAPRVGPRFRAKPWARHGYFPEREASGCAVPRGRGRWFVWRGRRPATGAQRHPQDSVWSATSTDTAETDGTFRLDDQPRTIRARVHRSMFVHFRSNACSAAAAPPLAIALSRPSVGHRVIRRPATHPRFRNLHARFAQSTKHPIAVRSSIHPLVRHESLSVNIRRPGSRRPPREVSKPAARSPDARHEHSACTDSAIL